VDQGSFYNDIAEYYDLIYADWEESMRRYGAVISELLGRGPRHMRILDVSAGIGTQALPLASLGYEVVARDLSPGAIARLRREAQDRGLEIDAAPSDMRNVGSSVGGLFDAVISFDNSIPHLLTDSDIILTFRGLSKLLAPDGVILVSIRDYDQVDRSPSSVHSYGERSRQGRLYRLSQQWEWYDRSHYRTTMIVEEMRRDRWEELVRTVAAYYAISTDRLLALMREAGLRANREHESGFFQPVLRAGAG
jgi:2-polyprenyl-3-methyl-5-hydroxy-6-metoxy-1,4-benzoquinol methylase